MTIEQGVRAVIVNAMGAAPEAVTLDARFLEDFCADSLDFVELSIQIEEAFEVEIADDEWLAVRTVGEVVELVQRGAEQRSSGAE